MDSVVARERWFVAILCSTFLFAIGPPLIQSFTAQKYQVAIGQQSVPLSGPAGMLSKAAPFLIIAMCLAAIGLNAKVLPRTGLMKLGLLLLPWVYVVIHDDYVGTHPHINALVYPMVATGIWVLRPRLAAMQWLGYLVGGTALLALAMGELVPLKGIYHAADGSEISPDKQILSSGILVGPLSSGNNLGQFLVMGIASVLLVRRRKWRWLLLVACLYASLWAASRSCLVAILVLLLMALVIKAMPRSVRLASAAGVLAAMVLAVVALPLLITNETSFSNRGYVWHVSKDAWAAHRWTGLGSDFYGRIAATSQNLGGSVFHGHNEFMQALVTGGYALALSMGLVIGVAIYSAVALLRRGHAFPTLFLIGFIGSCLLEVSYVIVDRYFALPVMLVPLAVVLFTADHADAELPGSELPDAEPEVAKPGPTEMPIGDGPIAAAAGGGARQSAVDLFEPVAIRRVGGVDRRHRPESTKSASKLPSQG